MPLPVDLTGQLPQAVVIVDPATGLGTSPAGSSALPAGNNNIGDVDIASIAPGTNNIGQVTPAMGSGGNTSVTTAASTAYTAFASQACKQLTIVNDTGKTLEVQQGGAGVGLKLPTATIFTFYGLTNASNLGVRTTDSSAVTATARWEA